MPKVKDRSEEVEVNTPILYCVKCREWLDVTRQECIAATESGKVWVCQTCRG